MQAPPPYSTTKGPPAYGQQTTGGAKKVYWAYWGVLFATLVTWVFAVAAAADDAWIAFGGVPTTGFDQTCNTSGDYPCGMFNAAKAFQFLATILVSFILVLVVVAAFMPAPLTGKLGLVAGIGLAVFSLFQLIAFAVMAALANSLNDEFFFDVTPGATLGVAVVAWLLGTAGAIATLVLLKRATTDQDGPFKQCMSGRGGANGVGMKAGAQASQPGDPVAGTV